LGSSVIGHRSSVIGRRSSVIGHRLQESDGSFVGPLHTAAVNGDLPELAWLLRCGNVHVDLPDADGVTPFMLSVLSGNFKARAL